LQSVPTNAIVNIANNERLQQSDNRFKKITGYRKQPPPQKMDSRECHRALFNHRRNYSRKAHAMRDRTDEQD